MFKAPVHYTIENFPMLRTSGRINKLAEVAQLKHSLDLIQCINISKYPQFDWNRYLRNAYLALGRLPDDDVEAHHIKNELTKVVDMFHGEIPFHPFEMSVTMKICDTMEDHEADMLIGKVDPDAPISGLFMSEPSPIDLNAGFAKAENGARLKFRLDVSREIGQVPMQELRRALAALPFDIELTTPLSRATLFNMPVYIASSHTETLPPEGAMDSNRFRLSLTFTTDLGDTGRELVKERMLERKVAGSMIWDDNTLVLATSGAKDDTLTDVSRWRNLVEREAEEVLASLTVEHKFDRLFR